MTIYVWRVISTQVLCLLVCQINISLYFFRRCYVLYLDLYIGVNIVKHVVQFFRLILSLELVWVLLCGCCRHDLGLITMFLGCCFHCQYILFLWALLCLNISDSIEFVLLSWNKQLWPKSKWSTAVDLKCVYDAKSNIPKNFPSGFRIEYKWAVYRTIVYRKLHPNPRVLGKLTGLRGMLWGMGPFSNV